MILSFDPQNGLTVILTAMEKIWSVRFDNLKIKPEYIKGAWLGMPKTVWNELRIPGSFVPGLIKAGSYFTPRGKEFWYVTRAKRHAVTIELQGDKKRDRLVLGFEDSSAISSSGLRLSPPPSDFEVIL